MTQIFAVDENNDLFLNDTGNLAISIDLQAILEMCEHVVKTVKGELILDNTRGVLGFKQNDVFGNSPNLINFESRAKNAMLSIDGVTEIRDFTAQLVGNVVQYKATIITIFGTEPINGTT